MKKELRTIDEDLYALEGAFDAGFEQELCALLMVCLAEKHKELKIRPEALPVVIDALGPVADQILIGSSGEVVGNVFREQFGLTGKRGNNGLENYRRLRKQSLRQQAMAYYQIEHKKSLEDAAEMACNECKYLGSEKSLIAAWTQARKDHPELTQKDWAQGAIAKELTYRFKKRLF